MSGLRYRLHLEEPVLATSVLGEPNSAISLPFIPGSMVRGAVISAWQQRNPTPADASNDDDFRRLFLDASTRYLHAYPVVQNMRALPPAASWRNSKDKDYADFLFGAVSEFEDPKSITALCSQTYTRAKEDSDPLLKQLDIRDGYFINMISRSALTHQVNLHTQRDAVRGRATEAAGAVFRYEALPPGLVVEGLILAENDDDISTLHAMLNEANLLVGGARTAGYGRVRVILIERVDDSEPEVQPAVSAYKTDEKVETVKTYEKVMVRCLSDVIVRDALGQHSVDLVRVLSHMLHTTVAPIPRDEGTVENGLQKQMAAFRGAQVVGGFDRTWGLPLPQSCALSAGSVFAFQFDPPIKGESLLALQWRGIGERRAEGFGRIAFMPTSGYSDPLHVSDGALYEAEDVPADLTPSAKTQAQLLLNRLLQQDLERALTQAIGAIEVRGEIPNSQLSLWRTLFRGARDEETYFQRAKRLFEFWKAQDSKNNDGWKKLSRASVVRSGKPLPLGDWLKNMLSDKATLGGWLISPAPRTLGTLSQAMDEEMRAEACLRLMDGVLARKAKQQRKTKRDQLQTKTQEARRG